MSNKIVVLPVQQRAVSSGLMSPSANSAETAPGGMVAASNPVNAIADAAADPLLPLISHLTVPEAAQVRQAWGFAQHLYGVQTLPTGELMTAHALGILRHLDAIRADAPARAAGLLFSAAELLARPEEQLKIFGPEVSSIALGVQQLTRLGQQAREGWGQQGRSQTETLRKMLLAFASDIRVVLVRLASRLQTLRYFAESKVPPAKVQEMGLARETMDLYAPLANRLGVWQIKWELEDLAFRFLQPDTYKSIARKLDEKRAEREAFIENTKAELRRLLAESGIAAEVSGRPKHIYSIYNKMRAKRLEFDGLFDVRALRVMVEDENTCYAALSIVHEHWAALPSEFDDYIARPKANGYRSLHTVVYDDRHRPFEVQIRTRAMHRFAEYGVAAHWRYKEARTGAEDKNDEKIAWLRQLLAWKSEVAEAAVAGVSTDATLQSQTALELAEPAQKPPTIVDDCIYVLTPQARVIELPVGSTPVDFAYHLHSDLGHRCRGARVNGAMVPLNTPLKSGQTVEIVAAKSGIANDGSVAGPSRDWLNPQLGFIHSPRARAKVRQWFNARDLAETIASGRAIVEKILQREGKTATSLEELARKLEFAKPDDLFMAVAKDEFPLRQIEVTVSEGRAPVIPAAPDEVQVRKSRATSTAGGQKSGVLVVGLDALMTELAKCCKPAPPDKIAGFVTRGRGVAIHRVDCSNFAQMCSRNPERVIDTDWGAHAETVYPVDIMVQATDRQGLLRDISEVFSREKINVIGVNTESRRGLARMSFTAEVGDADQLQRALLLIREVGGVFEARRK